MQDSRPPERHGDERGAGIGKLKTKSSRRSPTVACSLVQEIADFVAANPPGEDGLIFRTDRGGLVTSYQLTHATQRAARRAGLRRVSFDADSRAAAYETLVLGATLTEAPSRWPYNRH